MAIDKRIEDLLSKILNPEDLGYAASPALRDTIRFALGRSPVETDLVAYFPAGRSTARSDVLAERARQQSEENYSPSHDDRYFPGVLARAAACYADGRLTWFTLDGQRLWPFDREFYKPRSNRENWVRAAALLIAEIERSDREGVGIEQIKAHVEKIAAHWHGEVKGMPLWHSLKIERDRPTTFTEDAETLQSTLLASDAVRKAARQRLADMAVKARSEYNAAVAGGGEPSFPQWAIDVLVVFGMHVPAKLKNLDGFRAGDSSDHATGEAKS